MVVALGQREFKLLSDPGTAAAWLRAATGQHGADERKSLKH